jgi:hypothetical protein
VLSLALAATVGVFTPCRADGLVIQALNSSAAPGSTGAFDVVLINTNPTGGTSYDVGANSLDVSLSGPVGVTITDVNMNTAAPYIFAQSFDQNNGLPLATNIDNTIPTFMSNDSGDVTGGYPGFQTVAPGQEYGLAHVVYTVSPTAPLGGVDTITFNSIGTGTSLSGNTSGISFTFSAIEGTLTAGAVPEPSTLIQGVTAAMIGLAVFRWGRRSSARR